MQPEIDATRAAVNPKFLTAFVKMISPARIDLRLVKLRSNGRTAPAEYPPTTTQARMNWNSGNSKIGDSLDDTQYNGFPGFVQ